MTTADWNIIENSTNAPDVSFTCPTTANLYYSLFGEFVEGFSSFPIFDTSENPIVDTYYGQYGELVTGPCPTFDCNFYREDDFDKDDNNDREVADNQVIDNNDDQGEDNNQNSDKNYIREQREPSLLGKNSFLDKTQNSRTPSPTLVIPKKAFLDISKEIKLRTVTSNIDKKLSQ